MPNSLLPSFYRTEALIDPEDRVPEISENVQQTLARVMGFFDADGRFMFLRTDAEGRLVVTSARSAASGVTMRNMSVTVVPAIALNRNPNRSRFEIQIGWGTIVALRHVGGLGTDNYILVHPGMLYHDTDYLGDVYLATFAGSATASIREWS